ncbi:hypothetical protein EVAR_69957_1 [Eumeta japonica]|uniref:Uncharacterized protein n=1 Tax=Eumeta variegata TaxID=151549 RepID=A0A4C2AEQ4_EUMVA|nr:hypothetical protein EVAR_69957_1 [Eumeta japonica]
MTLANSIKIATLSLRRQGFVVLNGRYVQETSKREMFMSCLCHVAPVASRPKWAGHVIGRHDKWNKRVTQWYPRKGKRKRGRPGSTDGMTTLDKWQESCGTESLKKGKNGKCWRRLLPTGKQT